MVLLKNKWGINLGKTLVQFLECYIFIYITIKTFQTTQEERHPTSSQNWIIFRQEFFTNDSAVKKRNWFIFLQCIYIYICIYKCICSIHILNTHIFVCLCCSWAILYVVNIYINYCLQNASEYSLVKLSNKPVR